MYPHLFTTYNTLSLEIIPSQAPLLTHSTCWITFSHFNLPPIYPSLPIPHPLIIIPRPSLQLEASKKKPILHSLRHYLNSQSHTLWPQSFTQSHTLSLQSFTLNPPLAIPLSQLSIPNPMIIIPQPSLPLKLITLNKWKLQHPSTTHHTESKWSTPARKYHLTCWTSLSQSIH